MIKLLHTGNYKLVETRTAKKILILDGQKYAWIHVKNIGEILVFSRNPLQMDGVLSAGRYRLYQVKDEPELIDLKHLELDVGLGQRQGYLLLTGLPTSEKRRSRIIATEQLVSSLYSREKHMS